MIDERHQELASLYALDLLDGAERTEFETALAGSAELRQLVQELRQASTSLAHLAPPAAPSPALKQRLMQTVAVAPRAGSTPVAQVVPVNFRRVPILPWAIAAGFALAVVWLGAGYFLVHTENTLLRQREELAAVTLKSANAQVALERELSNQVARQFAALKDESSRQVAESLAREAQARAELAAVTKTAKNEANLAELKIATLVSMLNNSPKALAVAVWDPLHQQGVLTVDRMPPNAADRRYELWVIDGKPISAGVFTVGEDGRARIEFKPVAPVTKASKFAVSREANDGLASHATPAEVIMLSE